MGMELKFKYALFGVGAFLILFGLVFGIFNAGSEIEGSDLVDSLSFGFTSVFFALFSGVLIGVGATLIASGLVIGLRGVITHIVMSFLLSILSTLIAIAAIAEAAGSTFPTMVLFFAGMAASAAFMLATVIFVLSDTVKAYLLKSRQ
ncbi:Uncharacterised protein [uncultured archaeon]|nr:Uncharacterised protein [uncultured archaeon]